MVAQAYLADDLRRDLGVDRSDLIAMAYLLGSDYTDGVKGIGIVNAMEIIDVFGSPSHQESSKASTQKRRGGTAAGTESDDMTGGGGFFAVGLGGESSGETKGDSAVEAEHGASTRSLVQRSLQPLEEFKEWLMSPYDFASLKFLQPKKRKKDEEAPAPLEERDESEEKQHNSRVVRTPPSLSSCLPELLLVQEEFSKKHVGMRKKWTIKDSFPDPKIAEAYSSPPVNQLRERFLFETPKLFKIKKYVSQVLGWTEEEVRSSFLPPSYSSCLLDRQEDHPSHPDLSCRERCCSESH
jgi:hypothetical protein